MRKKNMVLNQETAMRLWNKQFGDETRVTDFANREIDKGAYNDRNSKYGWNVDHIFPVSQGGKTNDSNLIVCHIKTNDEKADKFPCFTANGIKFEIVKVQNHYEIKKVEEEQTQTKKPVKKEPKGINFMDSAAGIRLFKKLGKNSKVETFVAGVIIRFNSKNKAPIIEFIKELLGDDFYYEYGEYNNGWYSSSSSNDIEVIATQYDVDTYEKTADIIQKCVMLNTYFGDYFKEVGVVSGFNIYYREDCYDRYSNSFDKDLSDNLKKDLSWSYKNTLQLNKTVIENNNVASERIVNHSYDQYYVYDYYYVELGKNLLKEVDG